MSRGYKLKFAILLAPLQTVAAATDSIEEAMKIIQNDLSGSGPQVGCLSKLACDSDSLSRPRAHQLRVAL